MKRLLEDLDARFDLGYRVRGVPLGELIERIDVDLDDSPLGNWGTPGPPGELASASQGPVDLHYVPHLFPGMDPKLRLAHRLQYHLLPTGVPGGAPVSIAAVLESYCHLSGDLFGWEMFGEGSFLVWIVDVSGHGLETGLASAVIRVIIDNLGAHGGVDALVGELNEALNRCVRPGGAALFATGVFITLEADGTAVFCSAGHPPALVIGLNGEQRELQPNSRPVGLFSGQRFAIDRTRIAPGETLFLYTDGLIELTIREGEQYGMRRLREFLGKNPGEPRALTEALYREIASMHDMTQLDDDVTFVAARMREP
jgi:sigma-B regulation protein RsbU (phosphoserine phosphatase)